jgi:CBS domain-containing protein
MKVCQIMTTPAVTVRADTIYADIVEVLMTNDVGGLPVVDGAGRLVGIVTEADLVSHEAHSPRRRRPLGLIADAIRGHDQHWIRKASDQTAGQLMTKAPVVASPDDDVSVTARRMLEKHHKRLPVVDYAGHVVGIVSRHDLLRPLHRADDDIVADIDRLLGDVLRVPERHEARAFVVAGLVSLNGTAQWPSDVDIIENVVGRVPGVIAVENHLVARERAPHYLTDRGAQ